MSGRLARAISAASAGVALMLMARGESASWITGRNGRKAYSRNTGLVENKPGAGGRIALERQALKQLCRYITRPALANELSTTAVVVTLPLH